MHLQVYCVLLVLQSLTRGQEERFSQDLFQSARNKTGAREQAKDGVDRVGVPGEQCPTSYDECGKPDTKERVIDCTKCRRHKHEYITSTCDLPSPPLNVNYTFHFNTTTLKLSLELTWDRPDFGKNALWGYDIYLDGGRCIQIIGSGKEDGHYMYHGLDYDKYHVEISSLPRKNPKFGNSWDGTVEPRDDKCTMFKKHGKEPPFECRTVKNLRTVEPCVAEVNKSGAVVVAFDRPQWNDYDAIIFHVLSSSRNCMTGIKYKRRFDKSVILNTTTLKIAGVKVGCSYTLVANLWRKDARPRDSSISKITFKCGKRAKPTTGKFGTDDAPAFGATKKPSDKLMLYLVSAFSSVIILAVAACVLVRHWQVKRQRQQQAVRLRYQSRKVADGHESVGLEPSQPVVMILWCHGCKELENFVLLFAALLQGNGFLVKLDLIDNNVIAEQGGLANYLVRSEDDANYVIIVCTNNEDNSFNFILDIIRNKIMEKGCKARYIPVHIQQEMAKVVPPCLQGTAYRVPEKVEEIIQRMYKVPIYTLEEQPVVNTMCLDQTCMESLKKAAASFLKPKHNDCDSANCIKGVEPNERGFETKSYNSFTSVEAEMLLVATPDMAPNHLSCSEDSFFCSDLD